MNSGNIRILLLALLTITLFPALTYLTYWLFESHPTELFFDLFKSPTNLWIELMIGSMVGAISGACAWLLISSNIMLPVLRKYGNLIRSLNLTLPTIILVSFAAGIGEELFFRGAVQHYLGIWITAILFIAIHGYLDPTSWRISLYGALMTLIIALLGYMKIKIGLISSMMAHTVIDILLFYKLSRLNVAFFIETSPNPPPPYETTELP
jgi:membrane protease YdiL (CAAX protease family)